jgi:hypothetical protein
LGSYSACKFEFANKTDSELYSFVEKEVSKRIEEYNAADSKIKVWLNLSGCLVFGAAEDPKENQINSGLEYYKERRRKELDILDKMGEHKVYSNATSL